MQIAEKIFNERKRLGLSQEQLADQIEVSRQAVSKWESGQSLPDLDKIVLLSQIFEVSTDYLLKDVDENAIAMHNHAQTDNTGTYSQHSSSAGTDGSMKYTALPESAPQTSISARILGKEELQNYQSTCFKAAKTIALGVVLCIIGVLLYLILEQYISSSATAGTGIIALLICIAPAVALFISSGMKMEKYGYLKTDSFQLIETSRKQLEEEYDNFSHKFTINITVGVVLCIIAFIGYFAAEAIESHGTGVYQTGHIPTLVLLSFVAIAVYLFVSTSIRKECYDVLLQQNDFSATRKQKQKKANDFMGMIAGAYWCIVTAGFLGYSFITNDWGRSWIVWPVAGCLFGAIAAILTFYTGRGEK